MNQIISPETEEKIRTSTQQTLNSFYLNLSDFEKYIINIEKTIKFLKSNTDSNSSIATIDNLIELRKVIEYNMFITILHLDLSVIVSVFVNGKTEYEKLFSLKQGIVVINEGYKKIYNFVKVEENGDFDHSERLKSFWYRNIKKSVTMFPSLIQDCEVITNELEDFYNKHFESVKNIRNLTVHYDKEPLKYYEMLKSLDTEQIFAKFTGFIDIISKMYKFTKLLLTEFENNSLKIAEDNNNFFKNYIKKIEQLTVKTQDPELKTQLQKTKEIMKKLNEI